MRFAIVFGLALGTLHAQSNLVTATQRYFSSVRRSLESSADVMPAEKYGYRLTDGQMTFAEWLIHSAQRNYADCAVLKSETAPEVAKSLASFKTKDEVGKALKDSFAYCAAAVEGADEQKILASPQMTNAFLHIVVHNNEIYGNIVGYLRSSGIVPPSTAGRGAQTKK
jgi:hypothetical protein